MCGDSGQRHVQEQRPSHLLEKTRGRSSLVHLPEKTGVVQVWPTCSKRPGSFKSVHWPSGKYDHP